MIYINPELNATALVDPWDAESGSELSEHGKRIVTEKLQALGYGYVTFIAEHEMGQHVLAHCGKWLKSDSRPVEGWSYYDAPDGEVLTIDAGIDFTDPEMWA